MRWPLAAGAVVAAAGVGVAADAASSSNAPTWLVVVTSVVSVALALVAVLRSRTIGRLDVEAQKAKAEPALLDTIGVQLRDVYDRLDRADSERGTLRDELGAARLRADRLEAELVEARTRADRLQQEIADLKAKHVTELAEASAALVQAKSETARLQQELLAATDRIRSLERRSTNADRRTRAARAVPVERGSIDGVDGTE